MVPAHYISLFPPFPRENKVFVAMSFDNNLDKRWDQVIVPSIKRVEIEGHPLEPHRVDLRKISDSILTEILSGITSHLLIFFDITTIGYIEGKPIRNGNVMYELGIAHATRLPEEIIIFRSDKDNLLFDVANIRVNSYEPEKNPEEARKAISFTVIEACKEIQLQKHHAIKKASESLDHVSFLVLTEALQQSAGIDHPVTNSMGQILGNANRINSINRLLELGALKTSYIKLTAELLQQSAADPNLRMLQYQITPFGRALLSHVGERMEIRNPELAVEFEKIFKEQNVDGSVKMSSQSDKEIFPHNG